MSVRPRIRVLRLRQLSGMGRLYEPASRSTSPRVSPIDRTRSATRIERDIETLAGPDYTVSDDAIRRYAYTPVYRNTLDYFTRELEAIGFTVEEDPVGTLFARNRPKGEPAFGIGSHCDSNRNGGRYDGTMGVVTALEVCRLNEELGLGLPLQLISFLEEEGSGFGQMLLGSRIVAQRVTEEDLRETLPVDRRRPQLLGARRGGRLRAGPLARGGPRTRRADRLDRDAHRAGEGAPGHRQPDRDRLGDRRVRPRRRRRPRARRPRRRDADGFPTRPDPTAGRDDRRARAPRCARRAGHRRHRRRDRGRPGADQRDREPRALLARRPRPGRRRIP